MATSTANSQVSSTEGFSINTLTKTDFGREHRQQTKTLGGERTGSNGTWCDILVRASKDDPRAQSLRYYKLCEEISSIPDEDWSGFLDRLEKYASEAASKNASNAVSKSTGRFRVKKSGRASTSRSSQHKRGRWSSKRSATETQALTDQDTQNNA